jgi:hypothetical protein
MKDEGKMRAFVASVESDVGLQRKKAQVGEDNEVDDCLYTWFLQKRSECVAVNRMILKEQALNFNKLLGGDDTFKASNGWRSRWKIGHGICQINMEGEATSGFYCNGDSVYYITERIVLPGNLTICFKTSTVNSSV